MGQCKVERQVVAEVAVQAWRSPAGIQREGSKEAAEASRSPLEAAQSLEEEWEQSNQSFPVSSRAILIDR